jgi:DNA-directed RNA polymerase specialized sigma24 family protein
MSAHRNSSMTQTNWDLIRDAAGSSSTSQASLEEVARRSWPAIYAFIRASGRSPDDASELTQGFICDVFLSRRLLEKADQSRGRFRTLVMGSVRNYLADMHRRKTATTRRPKHGNIGRLDDLVERTSEPAGMPAITPEAAFNSRYVASIIRAATERLQRELLEELDEAGWEIFRLRVLQPSLEGTAVGYDEIAPRFGLGKGACAARLLLVKRRFATILMEELRATVADPEDLQHEVAELLSLLSR